MTAIVGFAERGKVWIGGDSAGVGADLGMMIRRDSKVFVVCDRFLIGYTTSFRMGQIIRYKFRPPEQPTKTEDFEYLCSIWMDSLRECLKSGGFSEIANNVESGGAFLLGYRGNLYTIYDDFQVSESVDNFAAVGCGAYFALGALHVAKGSPRNRVMTALEAAERFSCGVARPFTIEQI